MLERFAFCPLLAHSEGPVYTFQQILLSVALLVVSAGIVTTLFFLVLIKPIRRMRGTKRNIYLAASIVLLGGFMLAAWNFGWSAYYDYQYDQHEKKAHGEGEHRGVEYRWDRWHIMGGFADNTVTLRIEDILDTADPGKSISASLRRISPSVGETLPMTWNPAKKAFEGKIVPEGNQMEIQFTLRSGLRSYTDSILARLPAPLRLPKGASVEEPGPDAHDHNDGHAH